MFREFSYGSGRARDLSNIPVHPYSRAFRAFARSKIGQSQAQEVEDIGAIPEREPLVDKPRQGPDALERIRIDTYVGMAFSNLVALAIIITTAATLHVAGITDIETSSQAAEALKPIAGAFAFTVFTLGIVGTGLLAVPVLAGSAAYALGEARKWPIGLARRPKEAVAFYVTIALATMTGAIINFSPINPIRALYLSAVINGVLFRLWSS
jgi:Mn2+/Fe2+ NRAMP family transporter